MDAHHGPPPGPNRSLVANRLRQDPNTPYLTIARELGLSRERVRQIAKSIGYPARLAPCPVVTCPACDTEFRQDRNRNKTCSPRCGHVMRSRNARAILTCEECSVQVPRLQSDVREGTRRGYRHTWCSNQCQGRWLGRQNANRKNTNSPCVAPVAAGEDGVV